MTADRTPWLDKLALRMSGARDGRAVRRGRSTDAHPSEDEFSRSELLGRGARLGAAAVLTGSLGLVRIPGAQARTSESCAGTCASEYEGAVSGEIDRCVKYWRADFSKTFDFLFRSNPFIIGFGVNICFAWSEASAKIGEKKCLANCAAKKEPTPAPPPASLAPPPLPQVNPDAEGAISNLDCCNGAVGNYKCCFNPRWLKGECCVATITCKSCTGG